MLCCYRSAVCTQRCNAIMLQCCNRNGVRGGGGGGGVAHSLLSQDLLARTGNFRFGESSGIRRFLGSADNGRAARELLLRLQHSASAIVLRLLRLFALDSFLCGDSLPAASDLAA